MTTTRAFANVAAALLGLLACLPAHGAIITLQAGASGQPADIIEEAMLVQPNANDNFGGRVDFEAGVIGNGQVRTAPMRFNVDDPSLGLYAGGTPLFVAVHSVTLTLTTNAVQTNPANMDLRIAAGTDSQGDWVEGTGTSASLPDIFPEHDTGQVTYSERREGQGTGWVPNTDYHRLMGDGVLATVDTYPGINTTFNIPLAALPTESLGDLLNRWATGNNEGILINDVNRSGFARWGFHSSEAATVGLRPMLTIQYTLPEPTTMALLGMGGLALLRRRRQTRLRRSSA